MTGNFLTATAYIAGVLALCFYIVLTFVWLGTAIIADTSGGTIYKSLATPIDDCRDFKCVTILGKEKAMTERNDD